MKFDDVLQQIGEFGFYQKRLYTLLCIPGITVGSMMVIVIIVLYTPHHRCRIPGLANDTYVVQDWDHQQLINQTIPDSQDEFLLYDKCHVFDAMATTYDDNNRPVNATMMECKEWVYDKSVFTETFTSQVNLVCGDAIKTSHGMMVFYLGVFVGDIIFGLMADLAGRKLSLYLAFIVQVASAFGVAWSPNFTVYAILQFILGGGTHAVFLIAAVISLEIVGPAYRKWVGVVLQVYFGLGLVYLSGVSYFIRDWFYIVIACAIPSAFYLLYWFMMPESPRWLLTQGKDKQFEKVILKAAKVNKVTLPEDYFLNVEKEEKKDQGKLWDIFTSPVLLKNSLIMCFNWMVVSMTYYGVTMNAGNLGGDFYFNFFLMSIAEFPGYFLSIATLDRIGRKRSNCLFLCVGGAACICTIFTVVYGGPGLQPLTVVLAFIGKIGSSAAFGIVYVYAGELFPTVVRNVGMGASSCAARIGGMLAPYIAKSGEMIGGKFGQAEPLLIFGIFSILAGLSCLLLPETLNKKLPETIRDGEEFGKKKKKKDVLSEIDMPFIEKDPNHLSSIESPEL